MEMKTRQLLFVLTSFLLLLMPLLIAAENNTSLKLAVKPSSVSVGQQFTVEVLIKDAPAIYGADVQLTFDPAILEVVDMDLKKEGIQFQAGKFIDTRKSYPLQYQVDNVKGVIDYALTLLNPAPEVQGNGQLIMISFKAKANGKTTLSISEGMFGTKTGETITPKLDSAKVNVRNTLIPISGGGIDAPTSINLLLEVGIGVGALACMGLGVMIFRRGHKQSK
jgi:hypothetical protein